MKTLTHSLFSCIFMVSACGATHSQSKQPNTAVSQSKQPNTAVSQSKQPNTAVTSSMLTYAQSQWPSATHESLEEGRQLFLTKCNTCHALPKVHDESASEWPSIVEGMGKKAKLTEEQSKHVLQFILTARETTPK